jgi:hypothetical protein
MTIDPTGDATTHNLAEQVNAARASWIIQTVSALAARPWAAGGWPVGSMGRGEADAFSDVDLVIAVDATVPESVLADPVTGLNLPGTVLYQRPKPRNAPHGGAYLAVGIELAGLPVLVDIFVWPTTTAAVTNGAQIVYERDRLARSELGFLELLDAHRSSDPTGSDPQAAGTVLMLTQLAAKYVARGNRQRLDGICQQLGISAAGCDIQALRTLVNERIDVAADPQVKLAVVAVHRLLDLAEQHLDARRHSTRRPGS